MVLVTLGSLGCTATQLRISTVRQAKSLTETQYEQVLNNLAMFCIDPNALPSLVSLKSGSTQIGDTGQVGFLGVAGLDTKFGASPTVSGSRSIVDQWGTAPVTDDNVLKVLRMAYQTATGHPRWLSEDEANDIGHDLSQQVGTNADISTDPETLRTLASVVSVPQASQNLYREQAPPGGPRYGSLTDFLAGTLGELNDKLMNTLDETFLKYKDSTKPFSEFVIIGTKSDTTELTPEAKKRIEAMQQELATIAPGIKIAILNQAKDKVSTGLAKETARRINDIQAELSKIATGLPPGWFHCGRKHDVPKDACYVGHYKSCDRECYVWVCPDGLHALANFTLSVLKLSTTFQETQILTIPMGIQYSPAFSRPLGGR